MYDFKVAADVAFRRGRPPGFEFSPTFRQDVQEHSVLYAAHLNERMATAQVAFDTLTKRGPFHSHHAWFDLFDEPNKAEVRAKPKGHGALLHKRQKAELYQASVRGAEVG